MRLSWLMVAVMPSTSACLASGSSASSGSHTASSASTPAGARQVRQVVARQHALDAGEVGALRILRRCRCRPARRRTAASRSRCARRSACVRPKRAWRDGSSDSRTCACSSRPRQYSNSETSPSALHHRVHGVEEGVELRPRPQAQHRERERGQRQAQHRMQLVDQLLAAAAAACSAIAAPRRARDLGALHRRDRVGRRRAAAPSSSGITASRCAASVRSASGIVSTRSRRRGGSRRRRGCATCATTIGGVTSSCAPASGRRAPLPASRPRCASSSRPLGGVASQRRCSASSCVGAELRLQRLDALEQRRMRGEQAARIRRRRRTACG